MQPETVVVLKAALENLNRAVTLIQQENENLISGKAAMGLIGDAAAMLVSEVKISSGHRRPRT